MRSNDRRFNVKLQVQLAIADQQLLRSRQQTTSNNLNCLWLRLIVGSKGLVTLKTIITCTKDEWLKLPGRFPI